MSGSVSFCVITSGIVRILSMFAVWLATLRPRTIGQVLTLKGLRRFLAYYTVMPGKSASEWRVLARLAPYLSQHRGRLAMGFLAILFSNAFQMLGPLVMGKAVDSLYASVTQTRLLQYAGILVGLTLLEGICRFSSRWWLIGASRDMEYALRRDVILHLESLPMSFYQRNKTGELMSRATNDL